MSSPTIRFGHSAVFHNGSIYMFGGCVESTDTLIYTQELWCLNVETKEWKLIEMNDEKKKPSARNFHSCVKYGDCMLIFGGKSNGFMNDLWQFNFTNMEWTLIETKNKNISARYGHTCVLFKNELIVFGGYDNNGFSTNDLFSLNLETWEWKELILVPSEEDQQEISGRYHHACVVDEFTGNMFIFGGKSSRALTNDFIKVKLKSLNSENQVQYEFISKLLPNNISRFGQSSFLDENGIMYCLGGTNTLDCLDCISCDLRCDNPSWKPTDNAALFDMFSTLKERTNNFTNVSKEEALPVFHSLTPFNIGDSTSYFVFGGKIQYVDDLSEEAKSFKTTEIREDVVDLSLTDILNDDIYHVILSFLDIKSLNSLGLVSKNLRISQLTTDDRYWEDYFKQKVQEFKEGSKRYHYDRTTDKCFCDYDQSLDKKENIKTEFKRNLIELVSQYMTVAMKNYLNRTVNIERKDLNALNTPFLTKEELLEVVDVSNLPKSSSLKVLLVGDVAVGEY